ncbi:MAG: hypothetical protein DWQ07_12255 [Chloroflexi bacterium]|nr:MAG: hypothetical protein DWQ07_12255 [Chloroflexota bacterium]
MQVKMDVAIVMKNNKREHNGREFRDIKITEQGLDGDNNEFSFSADNVEPFASLETMDKVSIEARIGGYLAGFNQRLRLEDIKVKPVKAA